MELMMKFEFGRNWAYDVIGRKIEVDLWWMEIDFGWNPSKGQDMPCTKGGPQYLANDYQQWEGLCSSAGNSQDKTKVVRSTCLLQAVLSLKRRLSRSSFSSKSEEISNYKTVFKLSPIIFIALGIAISFYVNSIFNIKDIRDSKIQLIVNYNLE